MKKLVLPISILFLFSTLALSQCNDNLIQLGLKDTGGAKRMKEFPVRLKKVKKKDANPYARYVVSLRKGNQYRLTIRNDSLNKSNAFLTLSDDYTKYGTTFTQHGISYNNSFDFFCKNTGTYYITIQFEDRYGGCAVGILSYVDSFEYYEQ